MGGKNQLSDFKLLKIYIVHFRQFCNLSNKNDANFIKLNIILTKVCCDLKRFMLLKGYLIF